MNTIDSILDSVDIAPAAAPAARASSLASATPTTEAGVKRLEILEQRIAAGARSAMTVIETLERDMPDDALVSTRSLKWQPSERGVAADIGGRALKPSSYALGQVAQRAGVPTAYLRELVDDADREWRRALAADSLTTSFANGPVERALVRSVRGQIRGFLSDRFRRLDARPMLDVLLAEVDAAGGVPFGGTATETRVAMKFILPRVVEVAGDQMVLGGEWSTSDFGNGSNAFAAFALRVACLNGATRENILRQVHLGGRIEDTDIYSAQTMRLDTEATTSALRDVARHAFRGGFVDTVQAIEGAAAQGITVAQFRAQTKALPKATQKLVIDAFESQDVINLPPGDTKWRASNAISWIARHTADAEVQLDLERLAGSFLATPSKRAA